MKSGKRGRYRIRILCFCICLLGAGWSDFSCGKVKNRWLLAGAAAGLLLVGRDFFPAALCTLFPAYLLFRLRMMGAGDGKLMALITGYLGLRDGLRAIALGLLIGAAWSLYRLLHEHIFRQRLTFLTVSIRRMIHLRKITEYKDLSVGRDRTLIPLATCLSLGAYIYLLFSFTAAIGKELI